MERITLDDFNPMAAHPAVVCHIRHQIRKLAGQDGTVLVLVWDSRLTKQQISDISKDWDAERFRFPHFYT